jgi:hypothetical protein
MDADEGKIILENSVIFLKIHRAKQASSWLRLQIPATSLRVPSPAAAKFPMTGKI